MKNILLCVCIISLGSGCQPNDTAERAPQIKQITYTASTADIANPERGFYRYSETKASQFQPLDAQVLKSYRTEQTVTGATYSTVSTLVFRYYILDNLTQTHLPADFVQNIKKDADAARQAGVKLIPRFTYTITPQSSNCGQSICPPYGDAPKAIVLQHIAQLKPALQENADVIAVLQMGFIGIWGELYYSDFFGDASANGQGQLLDANWQDRADVLRALLAALPPDRQVQVRVPQLKQKFTSGAAASTSSAALTEAEAFTGSDKARIGFHNDCLLSSPDDYGTYQDYGHSGSPARDANTALRNYTKMDSRFVVVGGETCDDTYSPQNDCEPAGLVEKELSDLHVSYLNAHYNNQVNNDWQTGGCLDNIKRKLGYRLVLKKASLPDRVALNQPLTLNIELDNIGYAAPFNPRPVQLVWRNKTSNQTYFLNFTTEIRKWFTGPVSIQGTFTLPAAIIPGEYEMLLNLPDKYPALAQRPEFSIRLANNDTWEETTGYNKLQHSVVIF